MRPGSRGWRNPIPLSLVTGLPAWWRAILPASPWERRNSKAWHNLYRSIAFCTPVRRRPGSTSSRFGSPKPLARFAGETLAERAWRILGETFEARLAVGKGDLELPFPVVVEPAEPQAPLVGVIAGLRAAATETAVFLPVDCPLVTAALLRQLG